MYIKYSTVPFIPDNPYLEFLIARGLKLSIPAGICQAVKILLIKYLELKLESTSS